MKRGRQTIFAMMFVAVELFSAAKSVNAEPISCPSCATHQQAVAPRAGPAFLSAASTQPALAHASHSGMALIPGGTFLMGSADARFSDAAPVHRVQISSFWMDRDDVTNAEFAKFIAATGYVTIAERKPDAASLPGVPADELVAGAVVFSKPSNAVSLDDPSQWWRYIPSANWTHPEGPESDIRGKEQHPVVNVAWPDAVAYANWAGKRLPTEAEWEFAARGGVEQQMYVWGNELSPGGKLMANTFQGHFPDADTAADGFAGTSPVGSFPANGYGLHDMAGNVWQWCGDVYQADYYRQLKSHGDLAVDPANVTAATASPFRVMRGGSFLCTESYCSGFLPASRGKGDPETPSNHVGFRCVASADRS